MRFDFSVPFLLSLSLFVACGGVAPAEAPDASLADVSAGDVVTATPHIDASLPSVDVSGDHTDTVSDDVDDVMWDVAQAVDTVEDEGPPRLWANRAIGGMSMGAAAAIIGLRHPDEFDIVAGLGGYMDLRYMVTTGQRLQLGGFCPLEHLEAHVEALNDPEAEPPIFCGPVEPAEELEFAQDYNHFHYDTNGARFDRGFYIKVLQSLTMAFGNFTSRPTDVSPYLPSGVSLEGFVNTPTDERCVDPEPIPAEYAFNLEYNPEGLYPVIPYCDSDQQSDPSTPKSADFDPTYPHTKPVDIALAVDIDGDGTRDYGEPVFLNTAERYEDVGPDGCSDAREDGAGGCLSPEAPDAEVEDPNGDNYHWWDGGLATEGNHWRDPDEPFIDAGLDGVLGNGDEGEGNGVFDQIPSYTRADHFTASRLLAELPEADLERLDFYFDAGIRDTLHAAPATRRVVGALQARTAAVSHYQGIADRPGALFPTEPLDSLLVNVFNHDLSADAIGRHIYLEYGDPDASEAALEDGDGGHVGTISQALARIVVFLALAAARFPDPDMEPVDFGLGDFAQEHHFFSEALDARRRYVVALPPGYEHESQADVRYPVILFLHGLGQTASDLAPAALVTSGLMRDGIMPKALIVFPDGACCERDVETGRRECACKRVSDGMKCVDPSCQGPEHTCEERILPKGSLVEECNGGSLYFDLLTDRWGEPRDDLGYMTGVLEVIADVDMRYRTRPNHVLVP
ncbi:MAG: hypothetical protein ACPGU1_12225 [Myxococcota bacterium]